MCICCLGIFLLIGTSAKTIGNKGLVIDGNFVMEGGRLV